MWLQSMSTLNLNQNAFVDVFYSIQRPLLHIKNKMKDTPAVRRVAMESPKFKILEDPSQTLPERSPMGPIF